MYLVLEELICLLSKIKARQEQMKRRKVRSAEEMHFSLEDMEKDIAYVKDEKKRNR